MCIKKKLKYYYDTAVSDSLQGKKRSFGQEDSFVTSKIKELHLLDLNRHENAFVNREVWQNLVFLQVFHNSMWQLSLYTIGNELKDFNGQLDMLWEIKG